MVDFGLECILLLMFLANVDDFFPKIKWEEDDCSHLGLDVPGVGIRHAFA
jgi:hypothetical protein